MHKLQRSQEPQGLKQARTDKIQNWDCLPAEAKKAVRDTLLEIQNYRCAYCERLLHSEICNGELKWDGHIEHFRRKDSYFHPELTFVWENLFYSCLTKETCGKHKDDYVGSKEQYTLLIDPCKENPEDFLIFDNRGRISIRTGLSEENKKRAEFTIKAFHLDDPKLTLKRKELQEKYKWLEQCPSQDIEKYLLDTVTDEPFITAIFHYFGKRVVS